MTDAPTSEGVWFGVLGDLRIRGTRGDVTLTRPGYRRTLAWLLLDAPRRVEYDELIDRLWPDEVPPTARNTLQHYVSALRRALGKDRIVTVGGGYELQLTDAVLDAREFDVLVDLAHRASRDGYVERAVSLADSALEMWRGRPYQDVSGSDAALPEIRRLTRSRQEIEEVRLASLIDMGRPQLAVPELEAITHAEPLRERPWELLMMARYRSGEQAEALRAFHTARAQLAEQVGLEPGPGLVRLERQILRHDPTLVEVTVPRRTNLPPPECELLGRSEELATLAELATRGPVVTLTGPPGMGKTHLAIETARSMVDVHEDGVWMVSLRAETTMQEVTRAFSTGVGVDTGADLEKLTTHLRHLDALIVIDNAEHVTAECRRVIAEALKGSHALRFLVTSRVPIGVSGETIWRLRGLETDTVEAGTLSPAAELLTWRIQMVESSFRVTRANVDKLNAIASRADGVPLAMVLMASWLPAVGLDDVVDLMSSQQGAPGAATLDNALKWSYRLLSPEDVDRFNSLAVFVASFDLDAAHGVAGPELDRRAMIGVMARLVEASLLETLRAPDGSLRYRMLLPIRDHAVSLLEGSGHLERVHAAYIAVFHARAREFTAEGSSTAGLVLWPVDQDIAEYREVMRLALTLREPDVTADIASGLTEYWFARFLASEARTWLARAAQLSSRPPTAFHSWAAGFLAYLDDDRDAARRHFRASLDAASSDGDDPMRARALFGLGRLELFHAEGTLGAEHIEEAIAIWADDPCTLRLRTEAHLLLGMRATRLGATTDPHLTAAASLLDTVDDASLQSSLLRYRSLSAWNRGEFGAAAALAADAVAAARRADDAPKLCGALTQLSFSLTGNGEPAEAARVMLEALDVVEGRSLADVAQVLSGAVGLMLDGGHHSEAAEVLALLDEQYELAGMGPVDTDLAVVGEWRSRLAGIEPPDRPAADTIEAARRVLVDTAGT